MTLQEAYARCTQLAESHYENFPVGRLIAKHLRPHVHAIYAFARIADDFADEGYDATDPAKRLKPEERTQALLSFEEELSQALENQSFQSTYNWVFSPLADTAQRHQIPHQLFYDLLSAFRQDVIKRRYGTFTEVLDYCRRSANPIGRLVLHLHGYHGSKEHELSDFICTALQLANFWQDVSIDLLKDRIYLPVEDQKKFGFDEKILFEHKATAEFRKCMEFQVNRTQELFEKGKLLCKELHRPLNWEIRLTWLGGTTILKKIRHQNYDTLSKRPKLSKLDMLRLLPRAWLTC